MKTKKERNFVTIGDNFCHYLWRVGANFHNFQTFKKYANHQIQIGLNQVCQVDKVKSVDVDNIKH